MCCRGTLGKMWGSPLSRLPAWPGCQTFRIPPKLCWAQCLIFPHRSPPLTALYPGFRWDVLKPQPPALPECPACCVSLLTVPLAVRQGSRALATAPLKGCYCICIVLCLRGLPAWHACHFPFPCKASLWTGSAGFQGMLSFFCPCSCFSLFSPCYLHPCLAAVACSHTCAW